MQKLIQRLSLTLITLTLAGCFPGVFQINVQQGNIVDKEDLDQLAHTMSRQEIRQLLGTPMVSTPAHPDREHYVYTFQRSGGEIKQQRITIFYEDDYYLRHEAKLLQETPAN